MKGVFLFSSAFLFVQAVYIQWKDIKDYVEMTLSFAGEKVPFSTGSQISSL